MADKALHEKKFGYRPSSSKTSSNASSSASSDQAANTPSQGRRGVPQLGLRPLSPTAYPSGSQTQREAGRAVPPRTSEGESVPSIGFARISNAVLIHAGDAPTTASSTSADSTTASSKHGEPSSVSVAGKAESLQSKLPMKRPTAMPPLPLPALARAVPSDVSPPPSADTPPTPSIPESAQTAHQSAATQPAYVDELASPRSAEGRRTIRQIASDIVAAELENGLDLKQIGRLSPKLAGVSVYSRLASHVNGELAKSEFVGQVNKCKQAVMEKFGRNPDKLTVVEGAASDAGGSHTGVDLERIGKYLAPVFDFVCGPHQQFADSSLPSGVTSLFKAVDRELVAALLARREQQLSAQKLWSASLSPENLADKLRALGWTDARFKKLVNEGVFSAAKIHAFRVNMFTGLLFTRCISPFILYSADELQQESSKRTANPAKPLVNLSEGANKLFRKNHAAFVEDFINTSNGVLPENSAAALVTISAGEDRFSRVKTSKKAPSGSGKAYARSPGHHSAPVMPQGGDFKKLMDDEKKAVDAETLAPAPARAPVDPKVRRDAAIDIFKSSHAADFSDEDFAIAFSLALRQWKRDNREPDIAGVPAAMKALHLQVRKTLAEREKLERDGPPVQSPPRKAKTGSSQPSSNPTSASSSMTTPSSSPPLSPGKRLLDEERLALLNNFLKVHKRRASLERYPDLRRRVEAKVIAWVEQQSGGSFGLALKKIFEQELVQCFYQSGRIISDAPSKSLKDLKEAVRSWKDLNRGEILTLDVLWQIAPKSFEPLTLDRTKKNAQFLYREFLTEVFLQRDEVFAELQGNKGLKKKFLREVRHWILEGGTSRNPEGTVQQLYH
ncbi:MAG: hypothetical protein JWM30_962, partial [Burkholderia sp.]|nr:hypothetical protein [Burkholderia sp.]